MFVGCTNCPHVRIVWFIDYEMSHSDSCVKHLVLSRQCCLEGFCEHLRMSLDKWCRQLWSGPGEVFCLEHFSVYLSLCFSVSVTPCLPVCSLFTMSFKIFSTTRSFATVFYPSTWGQTSVDWINLLKSWVKISLPFHKRFFQDFWTQWWES